MRFSFAVGTIKPKIVSAIGYYGDLVSLMHVQRYKDP